MQLVATKNITLENVKKSNYWDLIALIVWNHYSETRHQDESQIEITEEWCGVCTYGSSNGKNGTLKTIQNQVM